MSELDISREIALKEGYETLDELIEDWAYFMALSKVDHYKAECDLFERKYGMKLENFEELVHRDKGKEEFGKEEDIEDWEFSVNALRWWERKSRELQHAEGD